MLASSVLGYTGSFALLPPASPGPDNTDVDVFFVNTATSNPQYIDIDMSYVYAVEITTNGSVAGALIVTERPTSWSPHFSFTVPKKVQEALIEATIYLWAPDNQSLEIWHDHQGDDPYLTTGTKVDPEQTDGNGNVLWSITVYSFSDFYVEEPEKPETSVPVVPLFIIGLCALSGCFFVARK
jgi:hypothetical protein